MATPRPRRGNSFLGASRRLAAQHRRTLMRTPVVKRHTSPESGVLLFFRRVAPGVVILWHRVLPGLRSAGAALLWLHHTRMEGLPPGPGACRARWDGSRRPRTIAVPAYRPPHKRGGTALGASALQGRGEGQPPGTLRPVRPLARSESQRPRTRAGAGPRAAGLLGVRRRTGGMMAAPGCQARPACPRAAAGAPAPLPALWRTRVSSPPPPVATSRRRHGPAEGPAPSAPGRPLLCLATPESPSSIAAFQAGRTLLVRPCRHPLPHQADSFALIRHQHGKYAHANPSVPEIKTTAAFPEGCTRPLWKRGSKEGQPILRRSKYAKGLLHIPWGP